MASFAIFRALEAFLSAAFAILPHKAFSSRPSRPSRTLRDLRG